MSRGLQAVYKLICMENGKAIYAYSGDNFSYPFDEKQARSYDGQIEIMFSAFDNVENNIDAPDLVKTGVVNIIKECYYAEKNIYGIDILALMTVRSILRKHKETLQIPKEGHWIV
ncbi:hypothetical protein [Candidatus Clostridium radicumherbarum]|uniref:Uncharacterized protein n=1 Tax=Candidatus Clostridium radicumherbarum TaxID=3381662 RepID=A0ABW8TVM3_9CLOT